MMRLKILLLLLPLLINISCGDESPSPMQSQDTDQLITFRVASNYKAVNEDPKSRYWVFGSDADGKPIGMSEIENDKRIDFNLPEDYKEGDLFTVTILQQFLSMEIRPGGGSFVPTGNFYFSSYTGFNPGEYKLINESGLKNLPIVGEHELTIQNYPGDLPDFGSVTGRNVDARFSLGTVVPMVQKANLTDSNADVFYTLSQTLASVPRYAFFKDVSVGTKSTIDYNDMKEATLFSYPTPGADFATGQIFGVVAGDYANDFLIFENSNEATFSPSKDFIKLYYADELNYPEVITDLNWYTSDEFWKYRLVSNQPAAAFKRLDADILQLSNVENEIKLQTSGNYDLAIIYSINGVDNVDDTSDYFVWSTYGSSDNNLSVTLPVVPSEITQLFPQLSANIFNFKFVELTEYSAMDGYSDYLRAKFEIGENLDKEYKEMLTHGKIYK